MSSLDGAAPEISFYITSFRRWRVIEAYIHRTLDPATYSTVHVVPSKHFFKNFLKILKKYSATIVFYATVVSDKSI